MERPTPPFSWRDRFGLFMALIAGLLLFFVGARIHEVSSQTGGDLATLTRERAALDEGALLHRTLYAFEHYRSVVVVPGASGASIAAARQEGDRAVAATSAFMRGAGAVNDVGPEWLSFTKMWKQVRLHRTSDGTAERRASTALTAVFERLQDVSTLTYDLTFTGQNVSDMIFARVPSSVNGVTRASIEALLFMQRRSITLPQRLELAIFLHTLSRNVDLSKDYPEESLKQERALTPAQRSAVLALVARERIETSRFLQVMQNHVLETAVPTVPASVLIARRDDAMTSLVRVNDSLIALLRGNLQRRAAFEQSRTGLYKLATLLAALLLVGLMLEIVRFVARRDRKEIERAKEESSRLSAELAREHAEKALALTEAQFRAVFDGAALGIAILDQTGAVVDANSVFRETFGRDAARFLDGHQDDLEAVLSGRRPLFEFEQHYMLDDRQELWVDATVSVVSDERNQPQFAMCMFRDITDIKRSERRLVHDMTHDGLTGLPNRLMFETQLRDRFAESGALLDSFFAVLFIDLDHFKDFNESLGHNAGDMVLQSVATRLRASLDPNDLVARLGSDEFAVLIRSLGDILHVESVARRILNNVCKPIQVGDRAVFAACSIGIAVGSATYERAEDVMRDANTAMSQAKSGGGSRYALFDSNMYARAGRRLQLTTDLRLALQRNEFRLLYQPIVRIGDATLAGCEALIRWDHPTEGLILPGDFMALAEQTGIAIPIGRFVIETACKQLAKWRQNWNGSERPDFSMSLNVSASEIFDPEFERFLTSTCENHRVDPREMTLEITESVVLDSNTRANLLFERLQKLGFKICIDDFGTGYSSLRYLQQFRIDQLKIDRSFVAAADGEIASEPIVRTLMTLAEAYDLRVVAEGVESKKQRDMLRQAGCRFAQGYFYSPAVSAAELATMYPAVLARKDAPATA
ncbi:MAG: hypothetical protein NVSMB31_17200 [Vulcanimicrobiaceae bacterium]